MIVKVDSSGFICRYILSTSGRIEWDINVNDILISVPWANSTAEHSEMVITLTCFTRYLWKCHIVHMFNLMSFIGVWCGVCVWEGGAPIEVFSCTLFGLLNMQIRGYDAQSGYASLVKSLLELFFLYHFVLLSFPSSRLVLKPMYMCQTPCRWDELQELHGWLLAVC